MDIYKKQHSKGKLHAYERIEMLVDEDSFLEIGNDIKNTNKGISIEEKIPYDGVITGFGCISGNKVFIYAQDFAVMGGTLGENHGKKIVNLMKLALKEEKPIIGILDSGGARIQEGAFALSQYGKVFNYNVKASGKIPQISIIVGPCAGGAVYSPALTDFVFIVDNIGKMFLTGAEVTNKALGTNYDKSTYGNSEYVSKRSGVAHFRYCNEEQCYINVKKLIIFLSNKKFENNLPFRTWNFNLPSSSRRVYDMKLLIEQIVDRNSFIEVKKEFALNAITGFALIKGIRIGMVANQPYAKAGILDCDASDKIAEFVRFCDSFSIPIITLVDVPGFMPGEAEEAKGIIRHGAKIVYAYSESSVLKITIVIRKAYGGAYIAMGSKSLGTDYVFAWENAEIAVMGAKEAVSILYKKELNSLNDIEREKYYKDKAIEYQKLLVDIDNAAKWGLVDAVIKPEQTNEYIFRCLCQRENETSEMFKHALNPL